MNGALSGVRQVVVITRCPDKKPFEPLASEQTEIVFCEDALEFCRKTKDCGVLVIDGVNIPAGEVWQMLKLLRGVRVQGRPLMVEVLAGCGNLHQLEPLRSQGGRVHPFEYSMDDLARVISEHNEDLLPMVCK